jgi:competence protein ComFC
MPSGVRARGGLGGLVEAAAAAVTSIFFPSSCRVCDELLLRATRVPVCDACLQSFEPIGRKHCAGCGLPAQAFGYTEGEELLCPACRNGTYGFARARSLWFYKGTLVRTILLLKFQRIEPLGGWFAQALASGLKSESWFPEVKLVVPVPLHRERERERGYNQADLIARPLARRLKLPYKPILLVRTKARPDKHILTLEERWQSVRGAFATRPGSQVDKQSVLLVDDVMTSGATLDACARALRKAGAQAVYGMTLARAVRDPTAGTGPIDRLRDERTQAKPG